MEETLDTLTVEDCASVDLAIAGGMLFDVPWCDVEEVNDGKCHVQYRHFIGDGFCDESITDQYGSNYNTAECGWDGGDCCEVKMHYVPPPLFVKFEALLSTTLISCACF